MTHKEYLELLIGPLANEGGGGGITPSGSITINKNTNGVDVTDKATAVVAVQGGLDAGYVPYTIPTGYTEKEATSQLYTKAEILAATQGTTDWVTPKYAKETVVIGDKIAITGLTSDTNEPYMVAGTITADVSSVSYSKVEMTVDYDGVVGVANPVLDITANGNGIDVKGRNSVNVNVPSSASGSVTLTKNTDSNGVDVSDKASAVVNVQGGAAYDYVWPYIPNGYTELIPTSGIARSTVLNFTAGQTNKQVSAKLSLDITLTNGDKVAIHGTTSDTHEEFVVAGTVSGKSSYSAYQYAKLNIDYNGMVGIGTSLAIKANANGIDVRGRNTVDVNVQNSGTIQITQNGQGISVDGYKYADVQVPTGGGGASYTDLAGVRTIATNGISADSQTPNAAITGLCFPDLEMLNGGNFTYFTALTDVYFGRSFQMVQGMSFDSCTLLAGVYLDYYASSLPIITNGVAPGQSTSCFYYLPTYLLQSAQWDQSWSALYNLGRLIDLDQAPYSPVVVYQQGQKCVFNSDTWENQGTVGHLGEPGTDPSWVQV